MPPACTGADFVSSSDFSWKDLNRHFWMIQKAREESSLTAEGEQFQKDEARAVAQYAANREDCRKMLILAKFRETYSQSRCRDSCDNCLEHHDASLQDMSLEAVKILRLVEGARKARINITENELVAAFKGRSIKCVKDKGLEHLPFSGAGSSVDQAIIDRIVSYLAREDGLTHFEQVSGPGGWNNTYLRVSIHPLGAGWLISYTRYILSWGQRQTPFSKADLMYFYTSSRPLGRKPREKRNPFSVPRKRRRPLVVMKKRSWRSRLLWLGRSRFDAQPRKAKRLCSRMRKMTSFAPMWIVIGMRSRMQKLAAATCAVDITTWMG